MHLEQARKIRKALLELDKQLHSIEFEAEVARHMIDDLLDEVINGQDAEEQGEEGGEGVRSVAIGFWMEEPEGDADERGPG